MCFPNLFQNTEGTGFPVTVHLNEACRDSFTVNVEGEMETDGGAKGAVCSPLAPGGPVMP